MRVALVAGTKGKGSTCAVLASILGAAGVRCGLYTKPHLQTYRERIRVDGKGISQTAFAHELEHFRALAERLPAEAGEPTTFEVTTALALDFFAQERCQCAVVEVGLGGRLDATNATEPELSVITSISYDHTAILGRTLGAIASEKAGILRHDRPALLAQQRPAAMRALRAVCLDVGAHCRVVAPLERDVPLSGEHQRQNAALAIDAAYTLKPNLAQTSIDLGLRRLRWPGRFEVIGERPSVVLDGAHNGASAEALARTLRGFASGRPVRLVIGINRDKDARAVLRPLLALSHQVWATQTGGNPRALAAEDLARLCRRLGAHAVAQPSLARALQEATTSLDDLVCVTGSLALVGEARGVLGLPPPEDLW
jgi:dihydrofolate synthase/folylpolyglutamate synthase